MTTQPRTLEDVRNDLRACIDRKTAADVLGVDPRTVTAGIADGTIPSIRVGRRVLIPRAKFLALFDAEAA